MDLLSKRAHMRGQTVQVGSTVYPVDEKGVCFGVSEEHSKRLLADERGWMKNPVRKAPAAKSQPKPVERTRPTEEPKAAEKPAEKPKVEVKASEKAPAKGRGKSR